MRMSNYVDSKELIYLYCLIPVWEVEAKKMEPFLGIDHKHHAYFHKVKDIIAVVCRLDDAEYSEERLEIHMNDPLWIQEKGRHHHQCVSLINTDFTVIPVSLCTLFSSPQRLEEVLLEQYDHLLTLFSTLQMKEEWSLKVYYDDERFKDVVSIDNSAITDFRKKLEEMPKGKQFFAKKKLDQLLRREIDDKAEERWKQFLKPLQEISSLYSLNKVWSKKATGRKEEMVCNSAFLLHREYVEPFIKKIEEYQQEHRGEGWIFECSGPWPPYHFAALNREE